MFRHKPPEAAQNSSEADEQTGKRHGSDANQNPYHRSYKTQNPRGWGASNQQQTPQPKNTNQKGTVTTEIEKNQEPVAKDNGEWWL